MTEWIGASEAAQRLGIKPASLYSYVSRGVLTPRRAADGRASLFDAAEVAGLARRGRPRRAPGGAELVIESELTEISDDHLRFRGYDAITLATSRSFEDVAGLLWTGSFCDPAAAGPWQATGEAIAAGTAAQAALPPDTYPLERLQVIVPAVAATDRLRLHLDRPAVMAAARGLIAAMVDCLPAVGQGAAADDSIASRLAGKLCVRPPAAGLLAALRAALVLLADHELAASTLAARVAASVRADPYAVVGTGLGAMSGALHGGAALGAEVLVLSAADPADAPRVVGELLRRGERIPGLGHFVYQAGDPRSVLLLDLIRKAAPDSGRLAVAEAVLAEARRRALPAPNIEFALAVLSTVAGMIPGPARPSSPWPGRRAGWRTRWRSTCGPRRSAPAGCTPAAGRRGSRTASPCLPRTVCLKSTDEKSSPVMAVRRLNHAVLYVSDLARTVEFYRYTLGFEVRTEIPGRAAFLRAPGSANDHDLGLFEVGDAPRPRDPYVGLYHLAWEVGTLAELAEIRDRLGERGALVGASDHRVSKSLYAKDPSGIEFEVMWRVPAENWEQELREGDMIAPLDLEGELARWGDRVTGAAAGSIT